MNIIQQHIPPHRFHIPVMGLAFTIDTPVKVARFGISSVVSIVEDRLIEMMRSHYYPSIGEIYTPITTHEKDYRIKRITDYLNLLNKIVHAQVEKLRCSAFEMGSEIVKYFEMLPDDSSIKQLYTQMRGTTDLNKKKELENYLRTQIIPGSIDVNIMSKIDRDTYHKNGDVIEDGSDAITALRGYAQSDLSGSSVIFSAGMNPRVYNYLERCREFDANADGSFTKKVAIKVSDYRSALIQGKYLAKKGIWVSEFRIESGLNCGGHAFATDGYLMGPILEEFKLKREELIAALFDLYKQAVEKKGNSVPAHPPKLIVTVQGGIGTYEEAGFLHHHYQTQSTGWGTPFLLVPEATTVDKETLDLLCKATRDDVVLSRNSPLGVRFHYLKGVTGEIEKQQRIHSGKPGSPCTEKYLESNKEFTEKPICTASRKYQRLKIAELQSKDIPEHEYQQQLTDVLTKECLCVGLSNSATISYNTPFVKYSQAVTICPGPNIRYFSKEVSLQTMTDHIYGRTNIISDANRPHMFIAELNLYLDYIEEQLNETSDPLQDTAHKKYVNVFFGNLQNGIAYYRQLQTLSGMIEFKAGLDSAANRLDRLMTSLQPQVCIL